VGGVRLSGGEEKYPGSHYCNFASLEWYSGEEKWGRVSTAYNQAVNFSKALRDYGMN